MIAAVIPDGVLTQLRGIGDPSFAEAVRVQPAATGAILGAVQASGIPDLSSEQWAQLTAGLPVTRPALDPDKLLVAQLLFARYGTEIAGALLLSALPQSYATRGAGVLGANALLETDVVRRIRRTALFVLSVTQLPARGQDQDDLWSCDRPLRPSTSGQGPPPWLLCTGLRYYHQLVRGHLEQARAAEVRAAKQAATRAAKEATARDAAGLPPVPPAVGPTRSSIAGLLDSVDGVPLNQEDLLGMQLLLGVTVLEVLERFGVTWTADEQDAWLHLWDVIGHYLGIGDDTVLAALATAGHPLPRPSGQIGLRPAGIDETRALLAQIRTRQWPDTTPTGPPAPDDWVSAASGRILTKALLDELSAAMPRPLSELPIAMIRVLAPDIVRRRLSLGGNGLILGGIASLPRRRLRVDRFTHVEVPRTVGGRALRVLANEVTSRATMRFLGANDFRVPGRSAGL